MWSYKPLPGGVHTGQRWSLHPAFWKICCALLLLLVIFREYTNTGITSDWAQQHLGAPAVTVSSATLGSTESKPVWPSPPALPEWQYTWARDGNNQALSASQCDVAFPALYHEIDRAQQHFSGKNISEKDIALTGGNDGGVRFLIVDSQVRIVQTRGLFREDFRHRIIAVVQQVVQAVAAADAAGEPIPNIEFSVVVDDIAVLKEENPGALWSFTRKSADPRQDNLWLVPSFHFFGAPPEAEGFRTMQQKFRRHDSSLEEKIPQVVWRGALWVNEAVRKPLLQVTADKEWANVSSMDWGKPDTVIPMDEFCKFRYTINTEGRSWSARMTHLFNCDSILFVHDVDWIAHYYHLINTGVNVVHVSRDFSDFENSILYYNENLGEAQQIADEAKRTFRERYTTPAATACYCRRLMRTWAETVSFVPRVNKTKDGQTMKKTRGITFEEFIVHKNDEDVPYKRPGR
ncbi:hypothetical protein CBER1_05225 [Cercospora berteroae]|uniref:Glycosyl transferase CAP10 domain-containing protein n=1 Tax=Cercospora berteroae TaxID=357750 RepID=A0A2S6BRR1_9PEZI|nr:hypothetical protein CBER1_05225 [Cercospora berteroae]